jgi:hypothetical protein
VKACRADRDRPARIVMVGRSDRDSLGVKVDLGRLSVDELLSAARKTRRSAPRSAAAAHGHRPEAMIVTPVVACSWLHRITDDTDAEQKIAQGRIDVGLQTLLSKGINAQGHTMIGQPMTSLLDGLRAFPASEVVMLHGGEADWVDASSFAERVRGQFGLRVTEVEPSTGSRHFVPVPAGREDPDLGGALR